MSEHPTNPTPRSDYMAWAKPLFDFGVGPQGDDIRCKRCGQIVFYLTMHAKEDHGDDVEVLPIAWPDTWTDTDD